MESYTLNHSTHPVFLTPKQFLEKYSFLSEHQLKEIIYKREVNGLSEMSAIHALNRKTFLINEANFMQWVAAHPGSIERFR